MTRGVQAAGFALLGLPLLVSNPVLLRAIQTTLGMWVWEFLFFVFLVLVGLDFAFHLLQKDMGRRASLIFLLN